MSVKVNFDGNPGITFCQGDDQTFVATFYNDGTTTPVDLTDATVEINLPRALGGTIKRTNAPIPVLPDQVILEEGQPENQGTVLYPDHGFVTGDPVQVAAQPGGTLPSPLAPSTNYKILVIDNNNFSFTDTDGTPIALTTAGTIGFTITNSNDVQITNDVLGQVTFNLRAPVSADTEPGLSQDFQASYTVGGKTRILVLAAQLDVLFQPAP